jgi:hypothetical protein
MNSYQNLVQAWRECPLDDPPFVLPGDSLSNTIMLRSYEEYTQHIGIYKPKQIHVGLVPQPYFGNLEEARIFLLTLNPRLSYQTYSSEYLFPAYLEALIDNLRQERLNPRFPLMLLNPDWAGFAGFSYWHKKLDTTIRELADLLALSYLEALSLLSQEMAILEHIPYHSPKDPKVDGLESTRLIREFVHQGVLPRARQGEVLLIVLRSIGLWGIEEESESVIVYQFPYTAGAHLDRKSPGGKAIIDFLAKHLG